MKQLPKLNMRPRTNDPENVAYERAFRPVLNRPDLLQLCAAIAQRAKGIVQHHLKFTPDKAGVIEPHPDVSMMDIALVYSLRGLDLKAMFRASDLDFFAEVATIQRNINRRLLSFPDSVTLRFAQSRADTRS